MPPRCRHTHTHATFIKTAVAPEHYACTVQSSCQLAIFDVSMMPASSVSALVFGHKESEYFAVGQITKDQVEAYAARKGRDMENMERWLRPILSYE